MCDESLHILRGVDHIINDKSLPKNIPICRISDDKLSFSMSNYIIMAVMYYHRKLKKFQEDKFNKIWDQITHPEIPVKIGILGFGALGSDAGKKLKYLGFDVVGYSLNNKFNNTLDDNFFAPVARGWRKIPDFPRKPLYKRPLFSSTLKTLSIILSFIIFDS